MGVSHQSVYCSETVLKHVYGLSDIFHIWLDLISGAWPVGNNQIIREPVVGT